MSLILFIRTIFIECLLYTMYYMQSALLIIKICVVVVVVAVGYWQTAIENKY